MASPGSDYDRIGGDAALRAVVGAFVDRFFSDLIIGFLFEGKDRARIVRHETELAAAYLGGPPIYRGRPLTEVHRPLRINRGHFRRRLAILRQVLADHGVPDDIVDGWIAREQAIEGAITTDVDCLPDP